MFKQGYYIPINKDKYIKPTGSKLNDKDYPKYRSSYELKFFKFCDLNSSVKSWSSEPFAIKYFNPITKTTRNYFIDFIININDKKFFVEIKPLKETIKPKNPYDLKQYIVNQAKWKAAKEYAESIGCYFIVITERELKIK